MRLSPVAAAVVALAGCGHEAPPAPVQGPSTVAAPPIRPNPPPAPAASSVAFTPPPAPAGPPFVQVEVSTTQGDLTPLLVEHAERARAKGLVPIVYFYADWCPPCQLLLRNMRDPDVIEGLTGAYLVKLNLDDWHDKLKDTGFAPKTIPHFYKVTADGKPSGKMLDGDKWTAGRPKTKSAAEHEAWSRVAVARMGAALRAFIASP